MLMVVLMEQKLSDDGKVLQDKAYFQTFTIT